MKTTPSELRHPDDVFAKRIPVAEQSALGYTAFGQYIPDRIAKKIDGYIERGEETGHFLTAVISNDLTDAVCRADLENLANLKAIVLYFYNCAPSPCWGSKANMEAWLEQFRTAPAVPA